MVGHRRQFKPDLSPNTTSLAMFSKLTSLITIVASLPLTLAQVCDCEGAVATLYDGSATCDPSARRASCTWMYPHTCCRFLEGSMAAPKVVLWHSASMIGIEDLPDGETGWALHTASGISCRKTLVSPSGGCLNLDGRKEVFGASWRFCKDDASMCPGETWRTSVSNDGGEECTHTVSPDVFYLREREGQEARAFDSKVVNVLDKEGAIDWETFMVREEKRDVFRMVVEGHGDGLSVQQVNALRKVAEDDERRGFRASWLPDTSRR
ncbi:hypothetical protein CC2G_015290 [Coprinopsis cinerea AmutBmut pab1-1]|nr:hypothetical protein CC2G_015290 [Coprinopsis cinerea AmutBmut pab1-1]